MSPLTLTEIWIYPIKSLGGISMRSSRILEKGLQHDRRWMLIDDQNVFMTQRLLPEMALLKVTLSNNHLFITKVKDGVSTSSISFYIDTAPLGEKISAKLWDDQVDVFEVDGKLSAWFTKELGLGCKLVSFPEHHSRPVDPKYKVNDEHVSLADAYPFLIIGQSTLDNLNTRLENKLPMNRFRPNFVFSGGIPHEEDSWRNISIGENRFIGVKNCARCTLTTIDQATAERSAEPLLTLSAYRKKDNKIYFGQNLVAIDYGEVRVGDEITIH